MTIHLFARFVIKDLIRVAIHLESLFECLGRVASEQIGGGLFVLGLLVDQDIENQIMGMFLHKRCQDGVHLFASGAITGAQLEHDRLAVTDVTFGRRIRGEDDLRMRDRRSYQSKNEKFEYSVQHGYPLEIEFFEDIVKLFCAQDSRVAVDLLPFAIVDDLRWNGVNV